MTWEDYNAFMLEGLLPKEQRLHEAHRKFKFARQKLGQTVSELVTYIDSLEEQMGTLQLRKRGFMLSSGP